jgi:hypothetical protein
VDEPDAAMMGVPCLGRSEQDDDETKSKSDAESSGEGVGRRPIHVGRQSGEGGGQEGRSGGRRRGRELYGHLLTPVKYWFPVLRSDVELPGVVGARLGSFGTSPGDIYDMKFRTETGKFR